MTFDQFENARLKIAVKDASEAEEKPDQRIRFIQVGINNNFGEGAGVGLIVGLEDTEDRTVLKFSIRDALMIAAEIRAACEDAVEKWNNSVLGFNNRLSLAKILGDLGLEEGRPE